MKFSLAQINPRVGDVAYNLNKILKSIAEARAQGSDAVIFPELAVTGYSPRDLLDYASLVDENLRALDMIRRASDGMLVIVGFVERNPSEFGKPFFNSAAVFYSGKEIFRYRKRLLPYYGIFDDERYFEPGTQSGCFEFQGKVFGLAICEDIWNVAGMIPRRHDVDPIADLVGRNLAGLFCLSASPFELGKAEARDVLLKQQSTRLGCAVYYCNQIGGNDEVLFDGASAVVSGDSVQRAQVFAEDLLMEGRGETRVWPADEAGWLVAALTTGIRDYVGKTGMQRVCLGLSGGIDSAVVAALAVEALGAENVEGVSLPSVYTSEESRQEAATLAKNLGIRFREISIQSTVTALNEALAPIQPKGLTLENIQPRVRMTILMAVANESQSLLLNTSNKSELAAGYATLYGDSAGAIAVLGDLTKRQVYAVAKELNRKCAVIPPVTLKRAPTAELRPGQLDTDSLPPYVELDQLVFDSFQKLTGPSDWKQKFAGAGEKFSRLHRTSEFKRRQTPPVLRVTSRAIGAGRRVPVAARHYADI